MTRGRAVLLLFWFLLMPAIGRGDGGGQSYVFKSNEENDRFVVPTSDKHYTQGLHLTMLWPDEEVPFVFRPLSWISDLGMTGAISKYGGQVGQEIYTPENTARNKLIRTDRPYAGWLYLGLIRENRGMTAGHLPTMDRFQIDLGVIGPYSFADESQVRYHSINDIEQPRGWRYQINNEPGIALRFRRRWLLWDTGQETGLRAQMIPEFGANLGNVDTSAQLGALLRVGRNIPDEFGQRIEPLWGWYLFSGLTGHAVLHNAFLDGNLISGSHSVSKEPAYLHARFGLTLELRVIEISYTYNYLSKQFRRQEGGDAYGSIDLTYRF